MSLPYASMHELEERRNSYEAGYIAGWIEQEERIIKLIQENFEEKTCSCTWDGEYPNCYEDEYEDEAITKLLALIKGEK